MGVGSTGFAALQLNRKFLGIEIDEKYFDAAKKRINKIPSLLKDHEEKKLIENIN